MGLNSRSAGYQYHGSIPYILLRPSIAFTQKYRINDSKGYHQVNQSQFRNSNWQDKSGSERHHPLAPLRSAKPQQCKRNRRRQLDSQGKRETAEDNSQEQSFALGNSFALNSQVESGQQQMLGENFGERSPANKDRRRGVNGSPATANRAWDESWKHRRHREIACLPAPRLPALTQAECGLTANSVLQRIVGWAEICEWLSKLGQLLFDAMDFQTGEFRDLQRRFQ